MKIHKLAFFTSNIKIAVKIIFLKSINKTTLQNKTFKNKLELFVHFKNFFSNKIKMLLNEEKKCFKLILNSLKLLFII